MSKHSFAIALLTLVFCSSSCFGLGIDYAAEEEDLSNAVGEERFFFFLGNNGLNLTQLAALAALAAASLLPLLGLAALGIMLWALLSQQQDSGYGSTGYGHGGGHSSYSSSYKRSFDPVNPDWESLSIMDWLAIAEDTYKKFDPTDIECQKRVVCELHQNVDNFGPVAHTITHYFNFLQYAQVLSIPEDFKSLCEELLDAADRGRTLKKDCSELFGGCDFSVKAIMEKYGHLNNNISENTI